MGIMLLQVMDDPDFNDSDDTLSSPDTFFLSAVGFELGIGVVALIAGFVFGPMANELVPTVQAGWAIAWGIGLGCLLAVPMVFAVQGLQNLDIGPIREINEFSKQHILPMIRGLTLSELAVVSICAGVGEELLFRGWLQMLITGSPTEWTPWTITVGVLASSLAFGAVHWVSKLYVIVVFLLGLLFGIMLVATENLLVPIAAHAMFDFIQFYLSRKEDMS